MIQWLEDSCGLNSMQPGPAKTIASTTENGTVVETIRLAPDAGLTLPRPACSIGRPSGAEARRRGPFARQLAGGRCAGGPAAVDRLVAQGYWVLVPEHVSIYPKSQQHVELADVPRLYAAAESGGPVAAGPPRGRGPGCVPLPGRAPGNRSRTNRDRRARESGRSTPAWPQRIEPRIAGVAAVNVTTFRDWAQAAAPEETSFLHVMPYLPGVAAVTDLDYCLAAVAPRPMVVARLKAGWSKSGFEQVVTTARAAYRLSGNENALTALGLRDPIDERIAHAQGVAKQVLAVAQAILPAAPGARDRGRGRRTCATATASIAPRASSGCSAR